MSSRRNPVKAEPDVNDAEEWRKTISTLTELNQLHDPADSVETANKYMRQFSQQHQDLGVSDLKPIRTRIKNAILDIRTHSRKDVEVCEKALTQISHLLSKQPLTIMDRRAKRMSSATSSTVNASLSSVSAVNGGQASQPSQQTLANGLTLVLPPRSTQSHLATQNQFPLQIGRRVAFRVSGIQGDSVSPQLEDHNAYEEGQWILAVVHKVDKNGKYTVQDIESDDAGKEPPTFHATAKSLIPLPNPNAPPNHPSNPSSYPEFPSGTTVLALFPDTTSFYKAVVIASPKEIPSMGRTPAHYNVRFDDDEGQTRLVSADLVIEYPGF